jgi:hypothetical protein
MKDAGEGRIVKFKFSSIDTKTTGKIEIVKTIH